MDFGRVPSSRLDMVDFMLPADHKSNAGSLNRESTSEIKFYIGCAKWGRKDWVGKLYPKGTKASQYLDYYSHEFNSIELNPTHYRMPEPEQVKKWAGTVPDGFIFCPKVYQGISHFARLKNQQRATEIFCEGVRQFDNHLGTVFLQLHQNFTPKEFDTLETYLRHWPSDVPLALELRNERWFHDPSVSDRLFGLMSELNVSSVITDTAGFRDLLHMRLPTSSVFIRFVGNSLHPTDYIRINDWIKRIGEWRDLGLETCYFFMHQHEELYSPDLIHFMTTNMNEILGTKVQVPKLRDKDV